MRVGGERHAPVAFRPGKIPGGHSVEDAGWAQAPVCTCAENLASAGIRCPDRPSRSQWAIPTEPSWLKRGVCEDTVLRKRQSNPYYRPGVAQRVGRGIALLFHDRGTRSG